MLTDLATVRDLIAGDRGLAVVATQRSDGSVQGSVVNAGVIGHPLTGEDMIGFVAIGDAVKLRDVFLSTGATHDDWPTYDRVMADERRCIVLVRPAASTDRDEPPQHPEGTWTAILTTVRAPPGRPSRP